MKNKKKPSIRAPRDWAILDDPKNGAMIPRDKNGNLVLECSQENLYKLPLCNADPERIPVRVVYTCLKDFKIKIQP